MIRFSESLVLVLALLAPVAPALAQVDGDGGAQPSRGGKSAWFESTELDLGKHLEGERATGSFPFRNPREEARRITSVQPSCTCSTAKVHVGNRIYSIEKTPQPNTIYKIQDSEGNAVREQVEAIPIGAGESGHIEIEVDLRGVTGPKEATLSVLTDDQAEQNVALVARAIGTQFFRLVPNEVNLNQMRWDEEKTFRVEITSPIQPDFDITGMENVPAAMKLDYRKELRGDAAVWIVEGTYGPNVDPSAAGGMVDFQTNVEGRKVGLRVMAWVSGPLEIKPGTFVPFGMIKKGVGATKTIEFVSNDDFDLDFVKVEFKNLTIDENLVTAVTSKDGKNCKLEIVVSKDAPRRLVRGDVVVTLNHPAAAVHELQFNGFVR